MKGPLISFLGMQVEAPFLERAQRKCREDDLFEYDFYVYLCICICIYIL